MLLQNPNDKRKQLRVYHVKSDNGDMISIIDLTDDSETNLTNPNNTAYWDDILKKASYNNQFHRPVFIIVNIKNKSIHYGGEYELTDYVKKFKPSGHKAHTISLALNNIQRKNTVL